MRSFLSALVLSVPILGFGCTTLDLSTPRDDATPHAFDAGWRGESVCEVLHEDEQLRIARCTFQSGIGHERHYHRPHFGYAMEGGTMRIEDEEGTREVEIPAGTSWSSDEVTVHEALNVGGTTTSYLIVEPR